jgi:hypothetical protein
MLLLVLMWAIVWDMLLVQVPVLLSPLVPLRGWTHCQC